MADPAHEPLWLDPVGEPSGRASGEEPESAASADMLEEAIDSAFETVDEDLFATLCLLLPKVSHEAFARIVTGLLKAMGYSAKGLRPLSDRRFGVVVGCKTALGRDDVYVEAIRAVPAGEIGRNTVQAFVGAWMGEPADRAALLTNGTLADAARDYLDRVGCKVVVIDGLDLAQLMIDHGVGLERKRVYHLRAIDRALFDGR